MRIFKYNDNIDTDVIIPARYLNITDPMHLAKHCMEDLDAAFSSVVKTGDIILAGENFGCGSSREHAVVAIKACGIQCVIAKNFARIFFRNALNIGLTIIECPEASDKIEEDNEIIVDIKNGTITNLTKNEIYTFHPYPDFLLKMIENDGLVEMTKKTLQEA